ncbi:TIGR03435 family protein [Terriglobus roseus]|uniref:TIGR03435 family protein n=1 Tax=Terriglobus roseus TaxID=392734 RepID=UPI0009F60867|nr:TIGR03435 family protein [Terriglobus roseus]
MPCRSGRYDFTLKWMPDQLAPTQDDAVPGLFTAMREQLGLELKPAKGPVQVLAVDAMARPGAN